MCGRFASYRDARDIAEDLDVDEVTPAAAAVRPSYNVAPTQDVRVVLDRAGPDGGPVRREMHAARWGLVPAWAPDRRIGNKMINARRESLDSRPAFRSSLARRRCVLPVDGYYEWQRRDGQRVPYFVAAASTPLALAGLYAFWRDPERDREDPDRWLLSTTVVTTAAVGELAAIHDRVPAVLGREAVEAWLDPGVAGPGQALAVLTDAGPPELHARRVSPRVNTPAVDDPSLLAPV